jgi:hypothetical protein
MAAQSKPIYFNIETEKELLDFANSCQPSFSSWVKQCIKSAIDTQKEQNTDSPKTTDDPPKKLHWKF